MEASYPSPCLGHPAGLPRAMSKDHVQAPFEDLQGRRLHNLSGQHLIHSRISFLGKQSELYVRSCCSISLAGLLHHHNIALFSFKFSSLKTWVGCPHSKDLKRKLMNCQCPNIYLIRKVWFRCMCEEEEQGPGTRYDIPGKRSYRSSIVKRNKWGQKVSVWRTSRDKTKQHFLILVLLKA